ncbi:MAG: hypothetical protein ACRC0Y_04710 [Fusobacteriaceae bacterium]
MARILSIKECIEILKERGEEATKKKVENFEKKLESLIFYNIVDENSIESYDLKNFKEVYYLCYLFSKKDKLLDNLTIKKPEQSKKDVYNYINHGNYSQDLIRFMLSLNIEYRTVSMIQEIYLYLAFFINQLVKKAKMAETEEDFDEIEKFINCYQKDFNEKMAKEKYEGINLKKYPVNVMIVILVKEAACRINNKLSYVKQLAKTEEILDIKLMGKIENYRISNLVELFLENKYISESDAEKEKCRKFIKDNLAGIKDNLPQVVEMFTNEDELKLAIVYLILKMDFYDKRNSFQSLLKKISIQEKIEEDKLQYIINNFNFVAVTRKILDEQIGVNEFYKRGLEIEKKVLEFSEQFIEYSFTNYDIEKILKATIRLKNASFEL